MDNVIFREQQKINQVWWIMLLVYAIALLCWWSFFHQIVRGKPWGNNPAPDWMIILIWLICGIGFPLFFNILNLIIEVTSSKISIRYFPLTTRDILVSEVADVEKRTYHVIREFGGWGIRVFPFSKSIAYNVKGNRGVELTLDDGRRVMLGTQKPDSLYLAIRSNLGKTQPQ